MQDIAEEVIAVGHAWDAAMLLNDADAIGRFMADDWTIIGSDGRVTDKETFLSHIRSGALTHDVMTSEDFDVRVYGDTAVVRARGVSAGRWEGHSFRETELSSCIFVKQGAAWKCVLTHLSRLPSEPTT